MKKLIFIFMMTVLCPMIYSCQDSADEVRPEIELIAPGPTDDGKEGHCGAGGC